MAEKYIPRDISWLSFNERVLQEAFDTSVPLIQRLRFLGIFSNNLDEFFKVRVATLKRMADFEKGGRESLGDSPKRILVSIQEEVIRQQNSFQTAYQQILADLANHKIFFLDEKELSHKQSVFVRKYFREFVLPVLVPIMLSRNRPFPVLREQSIYLAIRLSRTNDPQEVQYALVEIPTDVVSRFLILPQYKKNKYIILLEDVIRYCLPDVFDTLHFDHFESFIIKITRDAELDIDNDLSQSLIEKISRSLKQRQKAAGVRFVYDKSIPPDLLKFLIRGFQFEKDDVLIPGGRYHNFRDFMGFPNIGKKNLVFEKSKTIAHPDLRAGQSILEAISKKDYLLHLPYQQFATFIHLLRQAAIDPRVISIRLTAYRLAKNSQVINALINAARNAKKVTVVIELQARFDEAANIKWSNILQDEGVRVVFGMAGVKIHSKLLLIERKEGNRTQRYAAISTGNFHEGTAHVYSDTILFTADKRITSEVDRVFMLFDNIFGDFQFRHLLVSPMSLRTALVAMIRNEARMARLGKEAGIFLKLNSLVDRKMIQELYRASRAGVDIKCIVRGACSLVPEVEGVSENIQVISIVDKYLEHSRLYWFRNGGNDLLYISSADLMTRNLDHRIEVACPILDESLKEELKTMLSIQWDDNQKARMLDEGQSNKYRRQPGEAPLRSQEVFFDYLLQQYEPNKGKQP
jgi:polyphosphate kinase